MKKNKIKSIKHRIKKGQLKLSSVEVQPMDFHQVKEMMLVSAVANYLEENGIKENVFDFLDDAVANKSWKTEVAADIANKIQESLSKQNITSEDIKSVKFVNVDAYDSPMDFFKEELGQC